MSSEFETEDEVASSVLRMGLRMPLDLPPPEILKWSNRDLRMFGLNSDSAANDVSIEWGEVGCPIMYEDRQHRAEELAKTQLKDAGRELAALMPPAIRNAESSVFHKELQRIIALKTAPIDPHEAAVHGQFRWIRLFCEEVFTNSDTYRLTSLLDSIGMDHADCSTAFHSLDWEEASRDGDVVDARLEEWQYGLKRVWAKYQTGDREHEKVVAVCMHFPVLPKELPPSKKDKLKTRNLLLPGGSPVHVCGQQVTMHPFVLTMPRLDMLLRLQAAAGTLGSEGMQLTGVHGAGKSHMLEALASILVHGGECDLIYHRSPVALLEGAGALVASVAPASGPLGSMLSTVPSKAGLEALSRAEVDGEKDTGFALRHVDRIWRHYKQVHDTDSSVPWFHALLDYMKSVTPSGQARVVIMDEVNDMLMGIGDALGRTKCWSKPCGESTRNATRVPNFLQSWVEWKLGAGVGVLRILSSSPHGAREYVAGISSHPRFELRPPRADHLGAVIAVAPEYLMGAVSISSPHSGRSAGRMQVVEAVSVCDQLASNMRYVTQVVDSVSCGEVPSKAASVVLHEMVKVLADRLERILVDGSKPPLAEAERSSVSPLWQTCLNDASLTVCESQDDPYSRLPAGMPSIMAACAALGSLARGGPASSHLSQALINMSSSDFEEQCISRVYLNLLAHTCMRLPPAPEAASGELCNSLVPYTFEHSGPIVRVGEHRLAEGSSNSSTEDLAWNSSFSVGRLHFLKSNAGNKYSVLPVPVVSVARKLLGGARQRVVIQTVHNFPGIDIVELERIGSTGYVRLFEVTRSTVDDHATGKHVVEVVPKTHGQVSSRKRASKNAASKRTQKKVKLQALSCDSVWGDVFALCGVPKHTASLQPDGSVKLTRLSQISRESVVCDSSVGDFQNGTSLINALLASMGVPLVVRRTVRAQELATGDTRISHFELSVEQSAELCRGLFAESSSRNAAWGAENVTDWQLQVVYVSDTPEEDNTKSLLKNQSSISAPFVRYVFREQLRAVLPL